MVKQYNHRTNLLIPVSKVSQQLLLASRTTNSFFIIATLVQEFGLE